ncbi:MAG: hypothetical protein EOO56_15815 [Hymenobacter sp.]|nr:MAG: hypothetical protein EOO56_15815 [Hymenobacter sp.]
MINSAEEFIRLRISDVETEYYRVSHDDAADATWLEIIQRFPDYKAWVIHNKTVPLTILEILSLDDDAQVRAAVARKRKINNEIFRRLSVDTADSVRGALLANTNLSRTMKMQVSTEGSEWLKKPLQEQLNKLSD